MPGFTWRPCRKAYATILGEAGNDVIIVSRLLRHALGGKNMSMAQRHYVGQDVKRLRGIVDAAFQGVVAMKVEAGKGLLTCVAQEA